MKYWEDKHRTLYNGNCRSMSELADNSIQCCVTSPPYWGLRKYAGEQDSIWGGLPEFSHEWGDKIPPPNSKSGKHQGILGGVNEAQDSVRFEGNLGCWCSLCGAWRGSYGLEPTVEMYVQHTVEILREIRRVLRKDGVCFWNVGDSYASTPGLSTAGSNMVGTTISQDASKGLPKRTFGDIKPKDLCLIPFRVAIAAQSDDWWVRSVIIWSKPNPMPESVTDRPTDSHEYILMLTKSSHYFWDMEAVREKYTDLLNRWGGNDVRNSSHKYIDTFENGEENGGIGAIGKTSMLRAGALTRPDENGRNLRSVWEFPTHGYSGAHFATYPEKLVEICVKAATPEVGCCSKCGRAWERIVETKHINKSYWAQQGRTAEEVKDIGKYGGRQENGEFFDRKRKNHDIRLGPTVETKTIGWQPGCECNADKVPSIVLDPFCGSGTTLEVAAKLNRHAVGYEISEEYCQLIVKRNNQSCLL